MSCPDIAASPISAMRGSNTLFPNDLGQTCYNWWLVYAVQYCNHNLLPMLVIADIMGRLISRVLLLVCLFEVCALKGKRFGQSTPVSRYILLHGRPSAWVDPGVKRSRSEDYHMYCCMVCMWYNTHTTVLRLCGFCPGKPGWVGTRRNIHPLTLIMVINHSYLLPPSIVIHGILPVQSTCFTVFFHNLCPSFLWSTSWPGTLYFILHTFLHPTIIFFSQHMPIPLHVIQLHIFSGLHLLFAFIA